jgi:hypothetical protein
MGGGALIALAGAGLIVLEIKREKRRG